MNRILFILSIAGSLFTCSLYAAESPDHWQQMKGQDFIIYYRTDVPEDFVQMTMNTAQEEFQRVADNLGIANTPEWNWNKQVKIYIYSDAEDYVKNGAQAGWSHGAAFAQARTIKTYPEISGFFDTVLPHE